MKIEFLSKGKKKEIIALLKEKYGIEKFPFLLLQSGKEKIRMFSGVISRNELIEMSRQLNIEAIGLYFAFFKENELRLNLDACHLLNPTKNIFDVSDDDAEKWMRGEDLETDKEKLKDFKSNFVIIKNKDDIIGVGKANSKIINFLPKERRMR